VHDTGNHNMVKSGMKCQKNVGEFHSAGEWSLWDGVRTGLRLGLEMRIGLSLGLLIGTENSVISTSFFSVHYEK